MHLYIDFPAARGSFTGSSTGQGYLSCPHAKGRRFGCDDFSCNGYSPVDFNDVDLGRFPRVADAKRYGPATLRTGDALYLPAFWGHRLIHLPLEGTGRNIALSWTRAPLSAFLPQLPPFSTAITMQHEKWANEVQAAKAQRRTHKAKRKDEL